MSDPSTHPPDDGAAASTPAGGGKRVYAPPRVTDYGSVAKLTQGTRTVNSDFPQAGFKMQKCL